MDTVTDWIVGVVAGGTVLAILAYLWYGIKQAANADNTITDLTENSKSKDNKIEVLTKAQLQAEYDRRTQETQDAKTATSASALGKLQGAFPPDDTN